MNINQSQSKVNDILSTANSWADIKTELSKYNTSESPTTKKTSLAGVMFEYFTKYYFQLCPKEEGNYKNVWLFNEIPSEIKQKLNLGNKDYGVDLVLETTEGLLYAVQCKFRNDESSSLNWSADRIANLFGVCPNADGYIVFSNASKVDKIIRTRDENFRFYSISDLLEIEKETFERIEYLI